MTRRRWLVSVLVAAGILLVAGRSLAGVYSDYLWYESLGAGALWRARMGAVVILRLGSALAAALFAFANLYAVRQSVISLVFPRRLANLEIGEEVPGRYLVGAAALLAVVLGVLLALPSDSWMSLALAQSNRAFNEADPYVGQDLGFFIYWLPLESTLWMFAFVAVMVVAIAVVLLYALTPSLKWQRGSLYASTYVRRHMTVIVGAILLLLAWSFRLDMYSLLVDGSGADGAFTWADHRVRVPGDLLLSLTTLGAALIVIWAGFVGQLRLAAISVLTVIGLSLVVREIAPAVASRSGTDQQRAVREQAYLATRATYTRRAFDVDAVPRTDSSLAYATVTAAMPWVSAWDPPALARASNASHAADELASLVDWRRSSTGLLAVVVAGPPEAKASRTPWSAAHVLAGDADERGAPIRVPSTAEAADDLTIDAPLVYPSAPAMLVLSDSTSRLAGTSLESFFARLAAAWSTQNFRLLADDLVQPRPTLISHRDIRDRLEMYAPFFAQGRHVQPILLADSLYWAVDLYSTADTYPLSRHFLMLGDERTYLHHAAVAIVQASTGEVMVVADSAVDPITESWKSRLPSLFTTWAALPAGIRAQLGPPVDGLLGQANAFARYGARGESAGARHVAVLDGADSAARSDEFPEMVLNGATSAALTIPILDETERVRGVLIGTGGATHSATWYQLDAPGPRWNTVLDRLRSVDSASAVRDGPLIHGRVRAVPIRSGIAFLQPSYRWRGQNPPALNRVAILVGDSVTSVAPPLLAQPAPTVQGGARSTDVKASVAALYAAMRDALRRGDFAAFGRAFEALGRVIEAGRK